MGVKEALVKFQLFIEGERNIIIKEPALKATFLATMWEEMLEASLEDPSAWAVTRKQVREPGLKKGDVEKEEQVE